MTNWYQIFYWVSVADKVKGFFDTTSNIFTASTVICLIAAIICTVCYYVSITSNSIKTDDEEKTDPETRGARKLKNIFLRAMYVSLGLSILTWGGYVLTPSKQDAILIVAGGAVGNFITSDSSSKAIPAEAAELLRDKIRSEIKQVKMGSVTDTLAGKSKEELEQLYKDAISKKK